MDKESIAELLESNHQILIDVLSSQDDEKWQQGPEGKWTSGQQALHLLQSIKPLNDALSLPKFIIKYRFGTANRAVRDYAIVVNRYQERLQESKGIVYGPSKNMKVPLLKDKNYILNRLQVENKKLQYKTRKLSDKHLDTLILPHPLMGKMPLREIIMWTAYHVEHHTKQLQENY
ncbi:DinB family protein [Meridianimaribacter sp. CL38]|uniref:DinB family protein n=1 Tax=Meridianimaribacter sp. CL38 TaxID=2213021 RepID=UPI00103B12BF|nr:DinB family protein [Meridianimaribacter sp. CL38]TBV25894.1 DinB family protein [Meridianimaribacter sp. CL38]